MDVESLAKVDVCRVFSKSSLETFVADLTDGFTGLPLLLISGSILLGNHLVDWLKVNHPLLINVPLQCHYY